MKNTGKERAILYREFCEWCYTVPHLGLDPRLHTHSGRIEDGGYISNGVTAKAFAAWKAARCAPAAPQPQADALDATQILTRPAAAQKIPRDPIPTVDTWETCTIKEAKELNPALWRVRMLYPQEAIAAAIAAAKEN